MINSPRHLFAAASISAVLSSQLWAAINIVPLGQAAPPAALGGHTMTPFPLDARPISTVVTSVPSPLGGNLEFTYDGLSPYSRRVAQVGVSGWATWSHGYGGSVYPDPNYADVSPLEMVLPANTTAFYFYVESNDFGEFIAQVTDDDGDIFTLTGVGDSGAVGFGFYADPGDYISSVTVEVGLTGLGGPALSSLDLIADTTPDTYAVGEFGIATDTQVPEAETTAACGAILGLSAYAFLRSRRQRR